MTAEIDFLVALSFALTMFGVLVLYRQSDATYLALTALGPLSLLLMRFVDPRNHPAIFLLSALSGIGAGVLFYLVLHSLLRRWSVRGVTTRLARVDELDLAHLANAPRLRAGQHVTFELRADGILRSGVVIDTVDGGFSLADGRIYLVDEIKRLEVGS